MPKVWKKHRKLIHIIVTDFEAGQVLEGKVVSIKDYDYSILSGESGTILTLINGIYLGKEYPKLLMID